MDHIHLYCTPPLSPYVCVCVCVWAHFFFIAVLYCKYYIIISILEIDKYTQII